MAIRSTRKRLAAVAAAALVLASGTVAAPLGAGVAAAAANPGAMQPDDPVPADGPPASPTPMVQHKTCTTSAVLPDSQFSSIPVLSEGVFPVKQLHRFSRGEGMRIGIIDSGVNPNARLGDRLVGAGDYITNTNGLFDCDHHGTIVAGIIGAAPSDKDSFIGIAPGATLLSARQTSGAYRKVEYDAKEPSSLDLLAKAIVHMANQNVKVINMSVTACEVPGVQIKEMAALRGAIRYAAEVKDVVLVTPAGNVGGNCDQNPVPDPNKKADPLGWGSLKTWSIPSIVDDYILSVGGSTLEGDQYVNTLRGPWVDVSAPAINYISLDPEGREKGGLVNGKLTQQGTSPLSGTSFASALVAGLAALIRDVNPQLKEREVRNLIINSTRQTATSLGPLFGTGHVDPVVALTGAVDSKKWTARRVLAQPVADEPWKPVLIDTAKVVGLIVLALAVITIFCLGVMGYLSGATKEPDFTVDDAFGPESEDEMFGDGDEDEHTQPDGEYIDVVLSNREL